MGHKLGILLPEHSQAVRSFELELMRLAGRTSVEDEISTWHAPWREEALEHYLPMGWSWGVWEERLGRTSSSPSTSLATIPHLKGEESQTERLLGYVLAQPIIFFRGYTQTLWVENSQYEETAVGSLLVEALYRTAREKHLQRVYFRDPQGLEDHLARFGGEVRQQTEGCLLILST